MSDLNNKVFSYKLSMALVRKMLSEGIITEKEYAASETIIHKSHGINSCSIFREKEPILLDNNPL